MNEMSNKWIGQRTIRPDGADKVTGRAAFAADASMAGMIWGKVLRSPHPHARIRSIDTSKAEAHPGVKAVVTAADIVDFPLDTPVPLGIQDMRWMCRNIMAREKALFHGHPVAAVAATTEAIAAAACKLIEVDYEVLPWVIEIEDAIKPDAPILHVAVGDVGIVHSPCRPVGTVRFGETLVDAMADGEIEDFTRKCLDDELDHVSNANHENGPVLVVDHRNVPEAPDGHHIERRGNRRTHQQGLRIRRHHFAHRQRCGISSAVDDPEEHVAFGENARDLAVSGAVIGDHHATAMLALHQAHRLGDGRVRRHDQRSAHRKYRHGFSEQCRIERARSRPRRFEIVFVDQIVAILESHLRTPFLCDLDIP